MEYVDNSKKKGYKYEKGIKILQDIVNELGDEELKKTFEEYLKTLDEEIKMYSQKNKINKIIEYIKDSSSLQNLLKNVENLKELINNFDKLDVDLKSIITERVRKHVGERKNLNQEDIEIFNKLFHYGVLDEEVFNEFKENVETETDIRTQKLNKVRELLNEYIDDKSLIDKFLDISKNTIYKKVDLNEDYIVVPEDLNRGYYYSEYIKNNLEGIPLSNKSYLDFSGGKTYFVWLVPVKYSKEVEKIIELDENFEEMVYNYLKNMSGEGSYTSVDIFPTSWNHIKNEFVGILTPELEIQYISKRYNFTSSGKNSDLKVDEDKIKDGDLVVVKMGSYKHMRTTVYRKEGDKYVELVSSEEGLKGVFQEVVNKILEKE